MWSLLLIAVTLMIHMTAILGLAVLMARIKNRVERRHRGRTSTFLLVMATIVGVGWTLALLHGVQAAIWAATYVLLGAIDTVGDAMLYSVDSMSTRGASGLHLKPQWRMMGALEATNGVLLFGISTAFLAATIAEIWGTFRRIARD